MGNACASNPGTDTRFESANEVSKPQAALTGAPLTIKIMGARGLRNADWLPGAGASDCYCKVKMEGADEASSLFQTRTINNTLTPIWAQETEISEFSGDESLEFSVWDEDTGKAPDSLGKVVLKNEVFKDRGFNGELKLEDAGKGIQAFLRLKVKVAGQDYPGAPKSEFTIKVERESNSKPLGLDIDEADGKYIYICGVNAGPFKSYNDEAAQDMQLRKGDFVVSVNGKSGDSKEMLEELKGATSFEIVARHPEEICVAIDKKGAKTLGLDLVQRPKGDALLIVNVKDGPIKEWNNANEDQKVNNLDRVVSVAGCQGKATELQAKLMKLPSFQAIVVRPADPAQSPWHQ